MFRNFSGVGGLTRTSSSALPSPSTTPTASTPHDDLEDDSTPSSATPLTDSPPLFTKNTILVPVVDRLSAQKNCGNNFLQPPTILLEVANKCLSPIRELPTPSPSPALTPLMPRHIEEPSPTKPVPPLQFLPGSPPPQRDKLAKSKPLLKDIDKPTSLDLPCPPPVITVTCSMSEMESDTDSPATKSGLGSTSGMTYLSPFSMCSRGDRTTSESNLSSSGYSSMASPGPSRCGSNNPLCPTDVEDNHHAPRRPSPLLRTPCETAGTVARRGRSDSETLSDDPHLESNDEGFGTDQLEEKIEEGELKSARELELFMSGELPDKSPPHGSVKHCASFDTGLEAYKKKSRVKQCNSVEAGLDSYSITPPPVRHCGSAGESLDSPKVCKVLLQLPSIVVPVSSRSESPLSDKTVARFSPMFYGRLTDSDGLYDCNSSADWHKAASKKHSGRRRERKRSKSPTAKSHLLLDVPGKNATDTLTKNQSSRSKPSPKRRLRPQPVSSTSSSSAESLNSIRDMSLCLSSDKLADRLSGDWSDKSGRLSTEGQGEETGDSTTRMLLNTNGDGGIKKQRKISRMRTVGHQIRFLRRLEQSLKKNRERQSSPERPLLESSPNMREGRSAKAQRMAWLRQRGAASDGLLLAPEDRAYKGKASPTSGHTD
ncbi:hypothetical protein AAG570_013392 [Ranatra chinensis]|uniref:Uncharacterized protein n=1 Tax=Ranatra chinensis TaxID=642074 RepID=A0ABD0YYF2_9HEMI